MRSTSESTSVRLYHLSDGPEGGAAQTLLYGTLAEALALAAQQPDEIQADLFIATDNDVVTYLDLVDP
ncbi:hypothetical protein [Novosphingobium sp.]|uniref:hypothetical protein n=1 Tax=Novosphingobium sp. TaxID=1874826 RepID=UPI002604C596|nr:hypothetical protein [Novosphingobium sp.]